MEVEGLGDDALLRKLRNSRRSFQRRMQQLIEKVRVPAALRGEEDGAGASAGTAGTVQKTPELGAREGKRGWRGGRPGRGLQTSRLVRAPPQPQAGAPSGPRA